MDLDKLRKHVRLCKRNLRSRRVRCCATCPFEDEIVAAFPEMKAMFDEKRSFIVGFDGQMKELIKRTNTWGA